MDFYLKEQFCLLNYVMISPNLIFLEIYFNSITVILNHNSILEFLYFNSLIFENCYWVIQKQIDRPCNFFYAEIYYLYGVYSPRILINFLFSKISWLYLVGSMNLQKNLMICMHSVLRAFNGLTLSLNPIWMNTTIQIRKIWK